MVGIPDSTALRLAKAAADIALDRVPQGQDRAFMARALVLATLPHRDPGDVPQWRRYNGRFTLTLTPDRDAAGRTLYPYGSIPRLLLFWIVTEAVRTGQRRLELGRSLAEFMRRVGLDPATGGGKRGDARRLRDQMNRLFRARIGFDEEHADPKAAGRRWLNMDVTVGGEIWWSALSPDQKTLFGSYVVLSEPFFEAITQSPVPVDDRALRALRRSPLALDVYAWATYRVFTLSRAGAPSCRISWLSLQQQFGADYTAPGNFRKAMIVALRKVRAVYPAFRWRQERGGVRLFAGPPAVPGILGADHLIHGETVPIAENGPASGLQGVIRRIGR